MIKDKSFNVSDFKCIGIEVQHEGMSIVRNVIGRYDCCYAGDR